MLLPNPNGLTTILPKNTCLWWKLVKNLYFHGREDHIPAQLDIPVLYINSRRGGRGGGRWTGAVA
jgi:hypothetical protein